MPGEWFVDQPWGQLLYWPVDEGNTTVLTASILDTVISAYDVENLVFSGIRIESARSIAVHLFRGVGHQIVNCDVSCSGSSAICGVGTTIRKNHVHSDPDSAICLFGNEHLVEQNQIHHVCREADDSAAVHLSHDPNYRSNVIRKNHIHDL